MKACPFCAEDIQDAAIVCKHCGRDLVPGASPSPASSAGAPSPPSPGVAGVLSFVIPGLGQIYQGQVLAGLLWLGLTVFGYFLFIVPGLMLHIACVVSAVRAEPPERTTRREAGPGEQKCPECGHVSSARRYTCPNCRRTLDRVSA